ncbi:hypothetical protein LPU83_1532 [Rhizobium favelukesii]|uniref:Uncharacterized protein n=1 Tax=Rhizobium favelukesii TaxID=348824 RepID=W6R8G6_9HYPH|nr:hypothetical protein [Rhizobium favelukesii]CDM57204.1 hypothetical protein LPU83_1532 [Rhizobium favelukesii]
MGRRVFIGSDAGVMKFRATNMSTIDSRYADISQLTVHEQMAPMVPKDSGQITFGGAGSANVGLTKSYSYPPFILLKSSIGVVPGHPNLWATINVNSFVITISTRFAHTVTWCAFDELV